MTKSEPLSRTHVPPRRIDEDVLGLAEELNRLGRAGELASRYLQERTGLGSSELRALAAVVEGNATEAGAWDPQVFEELEERGLVTRAEHGAFIATEYGRVVHDQVDAMRIRIADHLVSAKGPEQTGTLRTIVEQMARAIPQPSSINA